MSRFLPMVAIGLLSVCTTLFAQTTDDFALQFNGSTDFVAMPQDARLSNTFTIELWAKPTAPHEIDREWDGLYAGVAGQRYAVYPSHGTHCWGRGHAGVGLSVGTNGVSVYEHAGDYMPAVIVYKAELRDWTHIAL